MDAISYTAARANLAKTMEKVCNDHTPIIITRKREAAVVMLSLDDYQAWKKPPICCEPRPIQGACWNRSPNWKPERARNGNLLNETHVFFHGMGELPLLAETGQSNAEANKHFDRGYPARSLCRNW